VVVEVGGAGLLAAKVSAQLPVEVFIYALDKDGAVAGFLTQTYGLELAKAEPVLRQGGFKFLGHLDLGPGKYQIRVLVRNGSTGASGLRVSEIEVPEFGPKTVLLPALFPDSANRWMMARETVKEDARSVAFPFLHGKEPFVPASLPTLKPGVDSQVDLVGYNLAPGTWKAEAKVLSPEGRELRSGGLKITAAVPSVEGSAARAEGTFRPPALPAGDYLLQITLADGSGGSGTSLSPFRLEGAILVP
jgi:hypothetical protein